VNQTAAPTEEFQLGIGNHSCPYNIPDDQWLYYNSGTSSWQYVNDGDVSVQCLSGNLN
jgi:hypothetical protein